MSELQKASFLYPSLNAQDQQNGVEGQCKYNSDIKTLIIKEHPLKNEVNKIGIFDLF